MSNSFDAYHKLLGIPPHEQPPDYYRLLGLKRYESSATLISKAADERMQRLKTLETSRYAMQSQDLLDEIATARICLLNRSKKQAYDKHLRVTRDGASHDGEIPDAFWICIEIEEEISTEFNVLCPRCEKDVVYRLARSRQIVTCKACNTKMRVPGHDEIERERTELAETIRHVSNESNERRDKTRSKSAEHVHTEQPDPTPRRPGRISSDARPRAKQGRSLRWHFFQFLAGVIVGALLALWIVFVSKVGQATDQLEANAANGRPEESWVGNERSPVTQPPVSPMSPGLEAIYFSGTVLDPNHLKTKGVVPNVDWDGRPVDGKGNPVDEFATHSFSIMYRGFIKAPAPGQYVIKALSDDGVRLYLDGRLILDRWYPQRADPNREGIEVELTGGFHRFRLDYFEWGGGGVLQVLWKPENQGEDIVVPNTAFFRDSSSFDLDTHHRVLPDGKLAYTSVEQALAHPDRVFELRVPNRGLAKLRTSFFRFYRLENLILNDNQVSELPHGIAHWHNLKHVDLRENHLTHLTTYVGHWGQLAHADFSHNELKDVTVYVGNWESIQYVDFSHNRIEQLPTQVGYWKQLRYVDFSFNDLASLPSQINMWRHVKCVKLSHNNLNALPELSGWKHVEWLDLSYNRMTSLPENIAKWRSLSRLDLTGNQFDPLEIKRIRTLLPNTTVLNNSVY